MLNVAINHIYMITYTDHGVALSQEQRETSIALLVTPWSLQQTGKQIKTFHLIQVIITKHNCTVVLLSLQYA